MCSDTGILSTRRCAASLSQTLQLSYFSKTVMFDSGLLQFATATTLPSYNTRKQLQESEVTDNTEGSEAKREVSLVLGLYNLLTCLATVCRLKIRLTKASQRAESSKQDG